jgi:hypothetical protein
MPAILIKEPDLWVFEPGTLTHAIQFVAAISQKVGNHLGLEINNVAEPLAELMQDLQRADISLSSDPIGLVRCRPDKSVCYFLPFDTFLGNSPQDKAVFHDTCARFLNEGAETPVSPTGVANFISDLWNIASLVKHTG